MGYGEKYIQELLGKCGTLDVADCIATVDELIKLGLSEPGRQIVQGGSHGGFLTAHRESTFNAPIFPLQLKVRVVDGLWQSSVSIPMCSARPSCATPSSQPANSVRPTSPIGPSANSGFHSSPARTSPQRTSPRSLLHRRSRMLIV